MDKLHITSIVGARPNFVKFAALSPEIRKIADETIIHTGQHYDYRLAKSFFDDLDIPAPDIHLSVGSAPHNQQIGEMMIGLDKALKANHPDAVIVYGDTNSTLAGALAAVKRNVPVIHIEAGCRSWDRTMPEEINRVIVDHISSLLFCPTMYAEENLAHEGISATLAHTCGDVMVDLLNRTPRDKPDHPDISNKYYLLTIHREENDNLEKLKEIFNGLSELKDEVVFPCHPRMRKHLRELDLPTNINVFEPVGYFTMRALECNAKKIITDSGGVQKEAYLFGVPCITLRNTTEWRETLAGNWNFLTGGKAEKIRLALKAVPDKEEYYKFVFGRPGVCRKIAKVIAGNIHG